MVMNKMKSVGRLAADAILRLLTPPGRRGVTAVEYAIIAGVLAAVIVLSVTAIGPELATTFNKASTPL